VQPEALTIPQVLKARVARHGQKPAVVAPAQSITYADLDRAGAGIAAFMIKAGVVKGARVGLLMENSTDWVCIAVAVMRMGAVLVPLSTFLRAPELAEHLRTAAVTHLFTTDAFRGSDYLADLKKVIPSFDGQDDGNLQDAALPSLKAVWRWSKVKQQLKDAAALVPMVQAFDTRVMPGDDMAILFTSGSSGAPKGVIHTHGNALRAVAASLDVRCVRADDRLYLPMPFFWAGGFATGVLTALSTGATLLTESEPEDGATIRFLAREKVTLFRGWPAQAERIANHPDFAAADFSSLRPGSLDAVMPAPLKAKSPKSRASLFGMTETFGPYCGARLDADMPEPKWGSCGQPLPGVDVRIVDPETHTPLPAGQTGAVQVRGPNVMRGICGRMRHETFDADGFYTTGDLGYLDADGYMFYAGRQDDMFKVKGATVYPSEVEGALQTVPGVARAFVTGIAAGQKDELAVGAAVVGQGLRVDAIRQALRERLSAFKMPRRWVLVSSLAEIPMLATGKLDRTALRRLLEQRGSP
jgi:acyl-CoA synthetase (AMP-forming)/AMP-acid ligase II